MTARLWSITHKETLGFSTIELLIAFSVGIIFLTAAMLVAFSDPTLASQVSLDSNQALAIDASLDNNALSTSSNKLGKIIAVLTGNWWSSITSDSDVRYSNTPTVTNISPCLKEISNVTTWNTLGSRGRHITFGTTISNMDIARGLGGDCGSLPIADNWIKPRLFSSHNFDLGKPVSIDVLNKIAYISDDQGNLQINDSTNDDLGSDNDFSVTPYTDPTNKIFNDVDVFNANNRKYALLVRHDPTNQFQIVDVTTPGTYAASPSRTLAGTAPPTGSFPQGWRTFYYDHRAYVTTRETAGREFHIFDVSLPLSPTEVGPAYEVNGTVNDLQVTSIVVNGHRYKIAFLATDRSANEVMVLNVTSDSAPTLLTAIDLPTTNDALSLQLLGNNLYIGRQRTVTGPELFVYAVTYGENGSSPTVSLSLLGTGAEINTNVTHLKVVEKFAFLGNSSLNELKIWDISQPTIGFARVDNDTLSLGDKVLGLDYEAPYLYTISQANDALQIHHSEP